jgi:hypothetical protein
MGKHSRYDQDWWARFDAAPQELRQVMHAAMKARDELNAVERLNGDGRLTERLATRRRLLEELEAREVALRNELTRRRDPDEPLLTFEPIDLDKL